jgi:urease accessory protein
MRSTASTALPSPGRTSPTRRSVIPTADVGRIGSLAIEYVRQGERTVFGRTNCRTPWHLLPPIYLDESGSAYTLLVNPSGGLVGGDHLSIHLSVGPKAHVLISTPSANRVYRSLSQEAIHTVTIAVADGGILEWMPEHTIPFAGSRFRQSIDVTLGHGAVVVLWDAVASGRIAQGERWRFTSVNNHICIRMPSQGSLCEQYALSPAEIDGGLGAAQEWDYVGSLFIVGDGVSATHWSSLEAALAAIVGEYRDQSVLGGVSQPAVSGVVVKLVAKSAPVMTHILMDMWAAVRRLLWQMPRADLRKY